MKSTCSVNIRPKSKLALEFQIENEAPKGLSFSLVARGSKRYYEKLIRLMRGEITEKKFGKVPFYLDYSSDEIRIVSRYNGARVSIAIDEDVVEAIIAQIEKVLPLFDTI